MAARGGMKKGIGLGAFGLPKAHGERKGMDIAVFKATNYEHVLPKEKHVRTIFRALSPSRPRSEISYCIEGLQRRLAETHDWAVVLKTMLIVHRAMRELNSTFWEELVRHSRGRGYMLSVSHFHDDSSPNALDFSAWIRKYGLYLEERLRCYGILNYDVGTYSLKPTKLDPLDLLLQLPPLQDLLSRILSCKPAGAAAHNRLIQYALSIIAAESIKVYVAVTARVVNLLDEFFEMHRHDAVGALEIYQKSVSQAERLSEFFETCRGFDFGRGQKFINIKKPPASLMTSMEEYINEAPSTLMLEYKEVTGDQAATANEDAAPVGEKLVDVEENSDASALKNETVAAPPIADLLGLDDLLTGASEFEENSLALAIVPTENPSNAENNEGVASQAIGWEHALFSEASSDEDADAESDLADNPGETSGKIETIQGQAGELDRTALDNLYGKAMAGTQQNGASHMGQMASNPFDDSQCSQGPFYASVNMAPPTSQDVFYTYSNVAPATPVQMVDMSYQQNFIMQQQLQLQQPQQQESFVEGKKSTNPFD